MERIPSQILSECFQEHMSGHRLIAAVFLTYKFDPAFFEQEILPVFVDLPLSHAAPVKLIQLEDALRELGGRIAVYYDAGGLMATGGSAKLDVRRIPVRHATGIFHAKNVFALVEARETTEGLEPKPRKLLVACMSANLTRSGWWENVEVAHVEVIEPDKKSRLGADARGFLRDLDGRISQTPEPEAVREIRAFLRDVPQREQRSADGRLEPHFFTGTGSLPDFITSVTGRRLQGMSLEILSPYFDDATDSRPLTELLDRFDPREARILLPKNESGEAQVRKEIYEAVCARSNCTWGELPNELLRLGKGEDAGERFVHAKVYRFFQQRPKKEYLFIGSANLTNAAHQRGGNLESGFLVEVDCPSAPEFWLRSLGRRPKAFEARTEDADSESVTALPLRLSYDWRTRTAKALWEGEAPSPKLLLDVQGRPLGELPSMTSREWRSLESGMTERLKEGLSVTSLVNARVPGKTAAPVLVEEEGMSHKPSLLLQLSAADILRYWALLTREQRVAFLETRAPALAFQGDGADLVARGHLLLDKNTLFDRFAGIFHAFGCVERAVSTSIEDGNDAEAVYRLFGRKYDSLGTLLERVLQEDGYWDDVDRYVVLLCAQQLLQELPKRHGKRHEDFWRTHRSDVRDLDAMITACDGLRRRLVASDPAGMPAFLEWFDHWFLQRATPVEEPA